MIDMEKVAQVAAATAAYKSIEIELDDQRRLASVMQEMRLVGRLLPPGKPHDGMIVSLPSGAGKSMVAERVVRAAEVETGAEVDAGPVRRVTLDTLGTVKSLWSSILEDLGDPYYASGHETLLRKRVRAALARMHVELLIIDEFNHVTEKNSARQVANAIKNLLTKGWVPVVVMGTSEELADLPDNAAFERRMVKSPGLPPRIWARTADQESWTGFLKGLDEGLLAASVLTERSYLDDSTVARALCMLCDGYVGHAHWIVGEALKDAVRRGRPRIGLDDLARNGDAFLVKHKRAGSLNPLHALLTR